MVADPVNDQVYYCGGNYFTGAEYVMAVSKTTNGGVTWQRSFPFMSTGFCYALAVDPSNPNIVFAGGIPGIFKSTNAGAGWTNSSAGLSGDVYALAIDPLNPDVVFAGSTAGVFKSTDAGASWTNTGLSAVRAVAVHPAAPDTVFAATAAGVFRSNTAGGSWFAMNTGLGSTNTASLGFNPGAYLFCGTKACGIYRLDLTVGVEERPESGRPATSPFAGATVFRGSLVLPRGKTFRVFDICGRSVTPARMKPGVYFVEVDGQIAQKVVKIR